MTDLAAIQAGRANDLRADPATFAMREFGLLEKPTVRMKRSKNAKGEYLWVLEPAPADGTDACVFRIDPGDVVISWRPHRTATWFIAANWPTPDTIAAAEREGLQAGESRLARVLRLWNEVPSEGLSLPDCPENDAAQAAEADFARHIDPIVNQFVSGMMSVSEMCAKIIYESTRAAD